MRATEEARTEHGIGAAIEDGAEQYGPLRGIILEVAILHDHDVARAGRECGADCRALPAVDVVLEQEINAPFLLESAQDVGRAIGGAIVHADDLLLHRDRVHGVENGLDGVPFVEHGNQHGEHELVGSERGTRRGVGTRRRMWSHRGSRRKARTPRPGAVNSRK